MSGRCLISYLKSNLHQISSMKEAEQTQAIIIKAGLLSHNSIISKLIAFLSLSPSGGLTLAQSIFEETTMDDSFTCNLMIRAYSKSAFPMKAVHIYNRMQYMNIDDSDHFTYNFVLKACARVLWCMKGDGDYGGDRVFQKGTEIHCRVLKLGFCSDQYIQNSLLHLYADCNSLGYARKVFDQMTEKTVVSWNNMISAYDHANDFDSADTLLEQMPMKNVVSWNSLITRYVRLRDVKSARRIFMEMPERNAVSWNSLISGYVQARDYVGAMDLYREMQTSKVETTDITLISILGACAETGALQIGREIHESLNQTGCKIEGYLGVALVDMYAKCGSLTLAWEVFKTLTMKPIGCWNAMIVGLAIHGYSNEALELFASMEKKKKRRDEVEPNRVTFIGVLTACSHKGLVEEGRKYFRRMIDVYGITPDMKHYGCMVDLLSRCGLLNEAYDMIETMPFGAETVIWRTLLAACTLHGNVELAEKSFRQLEKLNIVVDGDYVLLSNVYAETGRWSSVETVRSDMMERRVLKTPGLSSYVH